MSVTAIGVVLPDRSGSYLREILTGNLHGDFRLRAVLIVALAFFSGIGILVFAAVAAVDLWKVKARPAKAISQQPAMVVVRPQEPKFFVVPQGRFATGAPTTLSKAIDDFLKTNPSPETRKLIQLSSLPIFIRLAAQERLSEGASLDVLATRLKAERLLLPANVPIFKARALLLS